MFPGAQCSIVPKFQLLHSAKWRSVYWCPHQVTAFIAARKSKVQTPTWLSCNVITATQAQVFQQGGKAGK